MQCVRCLARQFSSKVRVLVSTTHNPFFNLATEEWIFRELDPSYQTLFLWRNAPTVVIGRYQNPWKECFVQKMEQDDVHLARRQSGGGAVYQDLGNTCYTFLSPKEHYSKEKNNAILIGALSDFDISAEATGRNDITVDGRKISGAAFKETADRAFHHGTLLIDVDMTAMSRYLNPDKAKMESKGIKSVQARVSNLHDLNPAVSHDTLTSSVIRQFFSTYDAECYVELLDTEYLKSQKSLNDYFEHLQDWNWRFGQTPDFSHALERRFEWGNLDMHLDVKKGVIEDTVIYSDCLVPPFVEALQTALTGAAYTASGVGTAVAGLGDRFPEFSEAVRAWVVAEL